MLIGVPKEIKTHEYRVGLVPSSVRELISHGHTVMIQRDAGIGIGFSDDDYKAVGAIIAKNAEEILLVVDFAGIWRCASGVPKANIRGSTGNFAQLQSSSK